MYKKGFTSQHNEIFETDLSIQGEIPKWLDGNLFRNGPGKFEYPGQKLVHWFDGPAMINRFSFKNGKMTYQNRFVRTEIYTKSFAEKKMAAVEFGTDPRPMWKKLTPPKMSDNVNVNFLKINDDLLTITGGMSTFRIDPDSLETNEQYDFGDQQGADLGITGHTPHPSLDTKTGDIYNIGNNMMKNEYIFYKMAKGERKREVIARVKAKKLSDIHSFSTTENYMIYIEIPWLLNKTKLIIGGSYLGALEWKPEKGTNFIFVHKKTGAVQTVHMDKAIHFGHTANAFEKDGNVIIDMPFFNRSNINDMKVDFVLEHGQTTEGYDSFSRFTIDLEREHVSIEKISDRFIELETIYYKKYNEKEYQFVYGPSQLDDSQFFDRLLKIDVINKTEKEWYEADTFPSETIFVPNPNATAEDDGVLLTVFLDGKTEKSFMHIMDAKSFTELARINLPQHIPFGFHGQFYSN